MEIRVLKLLSATAVVLFATVVVLFAFGTPQAPATLPVQDVSAPLEPGAVTPGSAGQAAAPAGMAQQDPESAGGDMSGVGAVDPDAQAPEADPRSPLAIQIPGCVCHSDDPQEVERHADYRMNQCAGCHMDAPGGP